MIIFKVQSLWSFSALLVTLRPFFQVAFPPVSLCLVADVRCESPQVARSPNISLHMLSASIRLRMSFMVSVYLSIGRPTLLEPSASSLVRLAYAPHSQSNATAPDENYLNICRFRTIHYFIVGDVVIPFDLKNGSQLPLLDCSENLDMVPV